MTNTFDGDAPVQLATTRMDWGSDMGTGSVSISSGVWVTESRLTSSCGGAANEPVVKIGSNNAKEVIF